VQTIVLALIALSLIVISIGDWKCRSINNASLGLVLILVLFVVKDKDIYWQQSLIVLSFGLLIWCLGVVGAGDIKLATVLSLAISPIYLTDLLLVFSFTTLSLIFVMYLLSKYNSNQQLKDGVPMGIPISISGFVGILATCA
jgi:prepilin peptidase CpaA